MQLTLALVVLVAAVTVAVPVPDKNAKTLKFSSAMNLDSYNYQYETSNGISAQETGELKNFGSEASALAVRGTFSFTADDGHVYTVNYIADENGFQPEGAHLPKK
ncbi:larval cuticle protein 65Ag1-like [Anopheles cruzii]|uniref:larval cuticle protein 65Ag1-like n=1 Tax=Anopheles cruzii TaxID=68878 RepID=UPI0022EC563B|nr:larval cuticle protein 65Ag1-like [Anopheles cruzii]